MYEIFVYMFGHNEIVIPLLPVSASYFLASCCEDIFLYHAIIAARLRTCIDFYRPGNKRRLLRSISSTPFHSNIVRVDREHSQRHYIYTPLDLLTIRSL